jgi:hypothetical protein
MKSWGGTSRRRRRRRRPRRRLRRNRRRRRMGRGEGKVVHRPFFSMHRPLVHFSSLLLTLTSHRFTLSSRFFLSPGFFLSSFSITFLLQRNAASYSHSSASFEQERKRKEFASCVAIGIARERELTTEKWQKKQTSPLQPLIPTLVKFPCSIKHNSFLPANIVCTTLLLPSEGMDWVFKLEAVRVEVAEEEAAERT